MVLKMMLLALVLNIPTVIAGLLIAEHGGIFEPIGAIVMVLGIGYASLLCVKYIERKEKETK